MNVLSLSDFSDDQIQTLLDLADRFERDGIPAARPGKRVCGLFFNPSLRTRTSLEVAAHALGAQCVTHDVGGGVWKLETRDGAVMSEDKAEHIKDAVGNFLSGVFDCIGVRCFADPQLPYSENRREPVLSAVVRASEVPVINLESATRHPMQALADLLVLRRKQPKRIAITWASHPRALPMAVANSAVHAFARAGYDVRVVHPKGFELEQNVAPVFHDMDEGLRDVDVIYAKSWGAIDGRPGPANWIVNAQRQGNAGFMHCLPVRRNVVVTDEVIDGPHSWVAEQARARVTTQAAVLHEVLS